MLYGISTKLCQKKTDGYLRTICMELKLRYTSRSHLSNTRIVYINTIFICHNISYMFKSESMAYHLTLLQKENIIIQSDFVKAMPIKAIMANRFITITIVTIVVRNTIMLVSNN